MEERLQKIIARAGIASRRAAEALILEGRVRINGRVITELGQKADPGRDRVELDGKRLAPEQPAYIVLHKPRDVVSTVRDPEGRPTVAGLVKDIGVRLYPVGRLDYATSGVLLMTNDGEFANALLHPRGGVPKTYVAKIRGVMSEEDLLPWRKGVQLEDGLTLPAEARILRHEPDRTWIELTIREGRNQQIRRMGDATGWPVLRLARLAFSEITSEGLRPGQWRHLSPDELLEMRKQFGVPKRIRGAMMTPGVQGKTTTARDIAGGRKRHEHEHSAPAAGRGPRASTSRRPAESSPMEGSHTAGRRHAGAPAWEGDRRSAGHRPASAPAVEGDRRGPGRRPASAPAVEGDRRGPGRRPASAPAVEGDRRGPGRRPASAPAVEGDRRGAGRRPASTPTAPRSRDAAEERPPRQPSSVRRPSPSSPAGARVTQGRSDERAPAGSRRAPRRSR
ncbi:pseudouridine synthase [Chondromyces apiculatus]|uniref:Pseudouridine synthase n=1 Tax=Chondromyces apiculatus DSM 436 TaxID=1192034 RepID=A0A017T1N4_9BACT|nr:pseudouridine synthase [Chondromyces apiculatus]EYF02760.1 Ribosomal large subunit pseudouridine synthase B [Chondromyces apiculatus DSM 436]